VTFWIGAFLVATAIATLRTQGSAGMKAPLKAGARPKLLVLNQYYWPGVEATARLLADLCAALADEYDITVITGLIEGAQERPRRGNTRRRVTILRVSSTRFDRRRLLPRGINYASYLLQSLRAGIAVRAAPTSCSR